MHTPIHLKSSHGMGERDLAAPGRPRPAPARVARCAAESGLLGIRIALSQITPAFLPVCERPREGLAQARSSGRKLGRPKGSLGVSRLNGKEDDIWRFLELGVSKTAIAKLTGGHVASQSGEAEYPKIASP